MYLITSLRNLTKYVPFDVATSRPTTSYDLYKTTMTLLSTYIRTSNAGRTHSSIYIVEPRSRQSRVIPVSRTSGNLASSSSSSLALLLFLFFTLFVYSAQSRSLESFVASTLIAECSF